jgi:hypothetical protein
MATLDSPKGIAGFPTLLALAGRPDSSLWSPLWRLRHGRGSGCLDYRSRLLTRISGEGEQIQTTSNYPYRLGGSGAASRYPSSKRGYFAANGKKGTVERVCRLGWL